MHLKSLVLKGFKSFADRSVMSFEPGIAAIVGPNGSGKSNISDAVLWVLGERNARNLRGQSMEDVIFSGSSARKPQGMAEVSLVLDNSDGTLPVEFTEVSLTRRMYRDGESEYLINGTVARRMDVLDILHDSGLGTGTHSIIGQGQLSSILQSRLEDRRALIEEAAGILKHKQRKEKSERKLASMDAHLTRVQDIVSEVKRQVRPLERKAKRALEHRDAARELADLDLKLAVDDLRTLQGKWKAVETAEAQAEAASADLHAKIQEKEREAQGLQDRLREFTEGAGEVSRRHRRAQAACDKMDSGILLLFEKKRAAVDYLAEMRISLENDARAADAARAQRDAAAKNAAEAEQADRSARAAREAAQAAVDDARRRQRALQQEIDRLSHARRDALSGLEEARSLLARTREILSSNRARSEMIQIQAADLQERLGRARSENEQASAQAEELRRLLDAAQEEEAGLRKEAGSALNDRDRARSAADSAREASLEANARLKSLEGMWRARQAKNPLRALGSGIAEERGIPATPLLSNVSVPKELEGLVAHLLGEDVNALFTEAAEGAFEVAGGLAGTAAAGVLSLVPCGGSQAPCPQGGVRLLDQMETVASCRGAFERLLGDVLLFEAFDLAVAGSKRFPGCTCASKDGFVVWANGKVTCYREGEGDTSELADFREIEQAREVAAAAESAFRDAADRAGACEEVLRKVQSASLEASQRTAQLKAQVQVSARDCERAAKALASLEGEAERLEGQKRAAAAALAKAEPDAESHEARAQALSNEIDLLKDKLDAKRSEISPVRAEADKAASDLSEAKIASAAASERLAYSKRMLESCESDIRKADSQAARARAGIARKEASLSRIDPLVALLTQLSAHAKAKADQLEGAILSSQSKSDELHGSINESRTAVRAAYEAYDAQVQKLADIRVEKSRIGMQVEAAIATIVQDCATPLDRALDAPELQDRALVEEKAAKLRRRISSMGSVDPEAVQEYEALKERCDYLTSQLDDMLAARRSLSRIVGAIDARMRDDFARTFESVNENFREAFASLFPGGKGELSLVDPDDLENTGVEVSAQPPGKRILKMTLMSGGEKSLTALALLFAVYKTRATPFYILDEVEAALDDTNLRRLVAYLDTLRESSQFIIITHQRRTMEMADILYGISMQSDGVTKVMSQRLDSALRYAEG